MSIEDAIKKNMAAAVNQSHVDAILSALRAIDGAGVHAWRTTWRIVDLVNEHEETLTPNRRNIKGPVTTEHILGALGTAVRDGLLDLAEIDGRKQYSLPGA